MISLFVRCFVYCMEGGLCAPYRLSCLKERVVGSMNLGQTLKSRWPNPGGYGDAPACVYCVEGDSLSLISCVCVCVCVCGGGGDVREFAGQSRAIATAID